MIELITSKSVCALAIATALAAKEREANFALSLAVRAHVDATLAAEVLAGLAHLVLADRAHANQNFHAGAHAAARLLLRVLQIVVEQGLSFDVRLPITSLPSATASALAVLLPLTIARVVWLPGDGTC